MSRSSRDSQKQKVYDGEPYSSGQSFGSLVEIERYFRHVLGLKIVQRRFGRAACSGTIAALGGGTSRATYHRGRCEPFADPRRKGLSDHSIMFTRSNRNEHVALHELAHHLTRNAEEAHGWEFAEALLWLERNRIGAEAADRLRRGWKASGARYTPPRKKRTMTAEQKAVARGRLAEIRERREAQLEAERGEWLVEKWNPAAASKASSSSACEYEWGEVGGAGANRQVRYWSSWPKNGTLYTTRSGAQKWADREAELYGERTEGEPRIEYRVVSFETAMEHYEANVAARFSKTAVG